MQLPRLIALELTQSCNLKCMHCRASATRERDPNELSTQEIKDIIDDIASFSRPTLILTGGEPLIRKDIYEIAGHATKKSLKVVVGTNGTLITRGVAQKLIESGVRRVSISIDCAYAEEHDEFRGVEGAYGRALEGIEACKEAGLEFQINTTVTKRNVGELQQIHDLALNLGAVAHHIFLLVPTGRGKAIEKEELSPAEYEEVLNWIYDMLAGEIFVKATCAPQFVRLVAQRSKEAGLSIPSGEPGLEASMSGCMGGISYSFISSIGEVNPCGYLPVKAGNVREHSFRDIWRDSELFNELRDRERLKGKCGHCEYKLKCGGCRARAYARYNDYLAEEPYCTYQPKLD